jgi:hypothetical protein
MTIEPINDFERAAREIKAAALADAYWERAQSISRSIDSLSQNGVTSTDEDTAGRVLAMVHDAKPRTWMSLAHTEHLALPSTKTMALAQAKVADRAHQVRGDYR